MTFTSYQTLEAWVPKAPFEQVDDDPLYYPGQEAQVVDATYGVAKLIYLQCNPASNETLGNLSYYNQSDYIAHLINHAMTAGYGAVSLASKTAGQYGWYVKKGNIPVTFYGAEFSSTNQKIYVSVSQGQITPVQPDTDYLEIPGARNSTFGNNPTNGYVPCYLDNVFMGG